MAATATTEIWSTDLQADRTQLVVDLGSSSLSLSLLSIREGLAYVLASSSSPNIGGDQIDDKLIKFFSTEFTKKTKTPLTVCPATNPSEKRAEAKLRLAVEHTKRTLSASPGAATCSVESLKDGMDFTGSVNRMRFDMIARPIYVAVSDAVLALLSSADIDAFDVDEIVYVGGTTCLPGLDEHLVLTAGFRENVDTPFTLGTVVGGGVGDPTTVLARGCAVQAALIASIPDGEAELREAFGRETKLNEVGATSRTVGLLLPGLSQESESDLGGTWIPVIRKETALPARRTVSFEVGVSDQSKKFAFEVWQVKEGIRVEKVKPEYEAEEEDEEEEEEVEVKHRKIEKEVLLGVIEVEALLAIKTKGKGKDAGRCFTFVEVQFIVGVDGALDVDVKEVGKDGAVGSLKVPVPAP